MLDPGRARGVRRASRAERNEAEAGVEVGGGWYDKVKTAVPRGQGPHCGGVPRWGKSEPICCHPPYPPRAPNIGVLLV